MDPIQQVQERLLATMRVHRREEVDAAFDSDVSSQHLAREAIASVLPLLPSMIDARVGNAQARIYSRDDLRRMLAEFAAELLVAQMGMAMRWLRASVSASRRAKEGA